MAENVVVGLGVAPIIVLHVGQVTFLAVSPTKVVEAEGLAPPGVWV